MAGLEARNLRRFRVRFTSIPGTVGTFNAAVNLGCESKGRYVGLGIEARAAVATSYRAGVECA